MLSVIFLLKRLRKKCLQNSAILTKPRWRAAMATPMETAGVTTLLRLASSHTEWMTKTKMSVMNASTMNPWPGWSWGLTSVLPKFTDVPLGVMNCEKRNRYSTDRTFYKSYNYRLLNYGCVTEKKQLILYVLYLLKTVWKFLNTLKCFAFFK